MANRKLTQIGIDGIVYDVCGWYAECDTDPSWAVKEVTIPGFSSNSVIDGAQVTIRFKYTNTNSGQINIRISGILFSVRYYNGNFVTGDALKAGDIITFTIYSGILYMDRRDYLTLSDLPIYDGTVT